MPRERIAAKNMLNLRRQAVEAFAHVDRRQRQIDLAAGRQADRHQPAAFSVVTSRCSAEGSMSAPTRSRQPLASSISTNEWPIAEETSAAGRDGTDDDRNDGDASSR